MSDCIVCTKVGGEPRTCLKCYTRVARQIREIVEYAAHLPGQAIWGQNGDPHGEHMLGGPALVMLIEGSNHVTGQRGRNGLGEAPDPGPAAYSYPSDPNPPGAVLATWENDWRHVLGMPPARSRANVWDASDFLLTNLQWAAQSHPAFEQFAQEIRTTARELEAVLHDGIRDEIGVRCIRCTERPKLRAKFVDPGTRTILDVNHGQIGTAASDQGGRRDYWHCPNPKCDEWYTPEQYLEATKDELERREAS